MDIIQPAKWPVFLCCYVINNNLYYGQFILPQGGHCREAQLYLISEPFYNLIGIYIYALCYHHQVCLFSTSGAHTHKELPHFKERDEKKDTRDVDEQTVGNEAYRMPHPIW